MKRKRRYDDPNPRKSKKIKLANIPFEINKDFICLLKGDDDLERLKKMTDNERDNELFHRWERMIDERNGMKFRSRRKSPVASSSSSSSRNSSRRNRSNRRKRKQAKKKDVHENSEKDLKYFTEPIFDYSTLQRVCLTLGEILKHIDEPYFERYITGSFVKVNLGQNSIGEPAIRIARVMSIHSVEGYVVQKKTVYHDFSLKIGSRKKRMRMDQICPDPPSSEEYLNYIMTLEMQKHKISTSRELTEHYLKNIRGIEKQYVSATHHEINNRMKGKIERKEFTNLTSFQLDQLRLRLVNKQKLLKEEITHSEQKKILMERKKKKKKKKKLPSKRGNNTISGGKGGKSFLFSDEDEDDDETPEYSKDELELEELKDELEGVLTDIQTILNEKKRRQGKRENQEDKIRKINERNRKMNKKISKLSHGKIVPPPSLKINTKRTNKRIVTNGTSSKTEMKSVDDFLNIDSERIESIESSMRVSPPENGRITNVDNQMKEKDLTDLSNGRINSHTTSPPVEKLNPFTRTDTKSSFWDAALGVKKENEVDRSILEEKEKRRKEDERKEKLLRIKKEKKMETFGSIKLEKSVLESLEGFEEIPIDFD